MSPAGIDQKTSSRGPIGVIEALLLVLVVSFSASARAQQPHIVVLLIDDPGYNDLGFQGSPEFAELTPRIDALAEGGVRFTSGYVSGATCSPSRAGLLTGRYQQTFGGDNNVEDEAGLPTTQTTLAENLRELGYRTYGLGKWHLGSQPGYRPNERGFDEYFGFWAGARTYFADNTLPPPQRLRRNGQVVPEEAGSYLTDIWGREAEAAIDDHMANHEDQPFFLYVAFNAVHDPMEADAARLADPRLAGIAEPNRRTLGAMTIALDDAVGVILDALTRHGLLDDTLVVFFGDNGGPEETAGTPNWSNNDPLRDIKGSLYEGGIRVPFVMRWPAQLAVGQVLDDPVIQIDLLPTLVAAAGGTVPLAQQVDGVDLLPWLRGATNQPPHEALFFRTAGSTQAESALRSGDWKLRRGDARGRVELYDLADDIAETTDLADTQTDVVEDLLRLYDAWECSAIEPLWGRGSLELSTPDLTLEHSALGYELSKSTADVGSATYKLRYPLPLDRDWGLPLWMELLEEPGLGRHGYVVLFDDGDPDARILLGVDLETETMTIQETPGGGQTSVQLSERPSGPTLYRIVWEASSGTLSLSFGSSTVSHGLGGSYPELDMAGHALENGRLRASSIKSHDCCPPEAVSRLLLSRQGLDLDLRWQPVTRDMCELPETLGHYEVWRATRADLAGAEVTSQTAGAETTLALPGEVGTQPALVFYRVRARDAAGHTGE